MPCLAKGIRCPPDLLQFTRIPTPRENCTRQSSDGSRSYLLFYGIFLDDEKTLTFLQFFTHSTTEKKNELNERILFSFLFYFLYQTTITGEIQHAGF